jgi:hypothetical protein
MIPGMKYLFLGLATIPFIYYLIALFSAWQFFRRRASRIALDRMGPWYLWCRVGVSLLRRNRGSEYRPGTGSAARCDSAGSPEAASRAHE